MKEINRFNLNAIVILFLFSILMLNCDKNEDPFVPNDGIFQVSTIDALNMGQFEGLMRFDNLLTKGDFGLGTFEAIDGEMVMLDGIAYQITVDGNVSIVDNMALTSFATVKSFSLDDSVSLNSLKDLAALETLIDTKIANKNEFYAVRVQAVFDSLIVRSVPRQQIPFPSLAEVVRQQVTYKHTNLAGTMVGFRMPAFIAGVNVPGYHFHFISNDRSIGGHLLACAVRSGLAQWDRTDDLQLSLGQ
jgi:acetolactate decarboxylase